MHVCSELSVTVGGLDDEELMATEALQDATWRTTRPRRWLYPTWGLLLRRLHYCQERLLRNGGTRRESEGAAALQDAREVTAPEAKGKTAAAVDKLQSMPPT